MKVVYIFYRYLEVITMTKNMIIEKKASKNDRSERSKSKNIENAEFTNGSSFEYNTLKRKIESVDKNISKRNKKRNKKVAPILNLCINEALFRTDDNVYEAFMSYYAKG